LKIGESFYVSKTNVSGVEENSAYSLVHSTYMPPYISVYDPTEIGGYNGVDVADGTDPKNPVRILKLTDRQVERIGILGNAYLSYEILDGLEYKFSVAMDYATGTSYNYTPKYTAGERDINLYSSLSESWSKGNNMQVENTLNYKKVIGKHKFSALAGYTRQWWDGRDFGVNVRDFPNTNVRVIGAATSTQSVSGSANLWSLASLLGRVTYNYDSKYLLTANMRRDGSSRFAEGNKYGVFPSFSAGWRLSEEGFLKNSSFLSDLKLKYGWGQLGMQEIGLYPYQATLTSGFNYIFGQSQARVPAITQLALSNRDISWESTTQSNIGLDMGLFDNSITVNLEYYIRKTNDMLIQMPVSSSAGLRSNPTLNSGSVENQGLDLLLSYQKQVNDFKFDISANASYMLKNEVTSLGARTQPLFGNTSYQRSVVGESIGHFYGHLVDHIYQTQAEIDADNAMAIQKGWTLYQTAKTSPGDIRFKDVNGDGHVTADDRTIIGSPIPKWNYGLTLNTSFKNFDFSMMLQGMAGFNILNKDRMQTWEAMTRAFNTLSTVLDRWSTTNPSTTMPRAVAGDPNDNKRLSDRFMEDGSYARIKLVTLGYNVPKRVLSSISNETISNVRIYASANNLLTFTKTTTWDPEFTSNKGVDNMYRGVAESIYPQARTIMLGIQVGF
jgi:TonB-linked SusC/RagA family outer membrane protein